MASTAARTDRPVTGWHVLVWMVAFFAVIFAANAALIYYALESFPGLEVASSYKAGQEYEAEIEAARAQTARHWSVGVSAVGEGGGARIVATFADAGGIAERGLAVDAALKHPTDSARDRTVVLAEVAPGRYEGRAEDVLKGRWQLVIDAGRGGERLFLSRNAVFLTP